VRLLLLRDGERFSARAKRYLAISLGVHLLAAWVSLGYHHHDEHFQVVEFAGLLLGTTPAGGLPWEYTAQVRPWMQPVLLALIGKPLLTIGIVNPFVVAAVFRIVSALLGWLCGLFLARACLRWLGDAQERDFAIGAATLAGFLPYLHARTSSENWSASVFWIGLVLLVAIADERRRREPAVGTGAARWGIFAIVGLLWGLAFEFRFQSAILAFGGVLWWVWFHRTTRREAAAFLGAGLGALALGALCDRVGYGTWVFPAIKYFTTNLIDGKAAEFGTAPWWDYFPRIVNQGAPPLGLFVALGAFASWVGKPRHALTWCTVPYFVVHALLAHKELRFLFPIAVVAPIQASFVWFRLREHLSRAVRVGLKWVALPINAGMLAVLPLLATRSEVLMDRFIYNSGAEHIVGLGSSPYEMPPLPIFFYRSPRVIYEQLSCADLKQRVQRATTATWVFSDSTLRTTSCDPTLNACEHAYATYPEGAGPRVRTFLRNAKLPDFRLLRCPVAASRS
jgi:phosphatidylinositol glycan class B